MKGLIVQLQCLLIVMLALQGCGHADHAQAESMQTKEQVGCYRLVLSSYDFGSESVYPRPPDRVELRSEPLPAGLHRGNVLRPATGDAQASRVPIVGFWTSESNGTIKLYWGRDFSGVQIRLQPTATGYKGTAETVSDVAQPVKKTPAEMHRTQC